MGNPFKCKKGDIVALKITRSHTFAIGSGRPGASVERWTLAKVERAGRDGVAKLLSRVGMSHVKRSPYDLRATVYHLPGMQDAAKRVFDRLDWHTDELDTSAALRAAIQAEMAA